MLYFPTSHSNEHRLHIFFTPFYLLKGRLPSAITILSVSLYIFSNLFNRTNVEEFILLIDKHYWNQGYVKASEDPEKCVPHFLQDLANDIYICGKTINLLKICSPEVRNGANLAIVS